MSGVTDVLMAGFFYVVAVDRKREFVFDALRDCSYAALPIAAAFGTMVGAALTYAAINLIGDGNMDGWAIPIATDIAFALAALGLVGRRAPAELPTFLLTACCRSSKISRQREQALAVRRHRRPRSTLANGSDGPSARPPSGGGRDLCPVAPRDSQYGIKAVRAQ